MAPTLTKKIFNTLIIFLFIGFILSSPVALVVQDKKIWSEAENRVLATSPVLPNSLSQLPQFFTVLEKYINDHFGFRDFYLRRYHREMDKRFGVSGPSSTVIKGLEGWYFFNAFNLLKDFMGQTPLRLPQLKKWLAIQEEKHDWLKEQGISYLYFAAPNKQSIYPEYLMKHALAAKGTSRYEQLLQLTNGYFPDYMVNIHPPLHAKAHDRQLYYKTDSHWNKRGAYLGFQEVFRKLSHWFPGEPFTTDFTFTVDTIRQGGNFGKGGDLVHMLMQSEITEAAPDVEKFQRCAKYAPIPFHLNDIKKRGDTMSYIKRCPAKNLKAIVFRDSFFVHLEPFFSENFGEVIYLWKGYDQQNMKEILVHFKPDIVIEEIVERHMFDALLNTEKQDTTE